MSELLLPRYLVINDWPDNAKHKIGDVIHAGKVQWVERYCKWLDTFPHLFRKLQWWEKRKIEEMPEYIMDDKDKKIYKVIRWQCTNTVQGSMTAVLAENDDYEFSASMIFGNHTPATGQEYQKFISEIK